MAAFNMMAAGDTGMSAEEQVRLEAKQRKEARAAKKRLEEEQVGAALAGRSPWRSTTILRFLMYACRCSIRTGDCKAKAGRREGSGRGSGSQGGRGKGCSGKLALSMPSYRSRVSTFCALWCRDSCLWQEQAAAEAEAARLKAEEEAEEQARLSQLKAEAEAEAEKKRIEEEEQRLYEEAKRKEAEEEAARLAEEKRIRDEKRKKMAERAAMFNQ